MSLEVILTGNDLSIDQRVYTRCNCSRIPLTDKCVIFSMKLKSSSGEMWLYENSHKSCGGWSINESDQALNDMPVHESRTIKSSRDNPLPVSDPFDWVWGAYRNLVFLPYIDLYVQRVAKEKIESKIHGREVLRCDNYRYVKTELRNDTLVLSYIEPKNNGRSTDITENISVEVLITDSSHVTITEMYKLIKSHIKKYMNEHEDQKMLAVYCCVMIAFQNNFGPVV